MIDKLRLQHIAATLSDVYFNMHVLLYNVQFVAKGNSQPIG